MRLLRENIFRLFALMPDDPDVHYNLAFVSSEHLDDYKTALKHYRIYLYFKSNGEGYTAC